MQTYRHDGVETGEYDPDTFQVIREGGTGETVTVSEVF
ncbi:hypothetical protein EM6_0506 [Asticcacaulis excentricus]|uniref:Uncharacterized protein n=1 Tax=Asticcacaulis excentricus TaxID=78587 RepID=A0A3G9G6R0_9CAUL|nr:hypothetical protein EM6_0506 [Asticcacaulis excentricus]